MKLPYASSSPVLWLDPSERYVIKDANNKVYSVIDRISGRPIIQTDVTQQPTWSATGINNTPSLIYNGNQFLTANYIAQYFNSGNTPITMVLTFKAAPGFLDNPGVFATLLAMTSTFANPALLPGTIDLFIRNFNGDKIIAPNYHDDANNSTNSFATLLPSPNAAHVATMTLNASNLVLRIDGITILNKAIAIPGTSTQKDRFTIGKVGDPKVISLFYFFGSIGQVIVYLGSVGIPEVEQALLQDLNQ